MSGEDQNSHRQKFNIFNSYFVLSIFSAKNAKNGEMLKMLNLQKLQIQHYMGNVEDVELSGQIFGAPLEKALKFNIFNIFSIWWFPGTCWTCSFLQAHHL